MNLLTVNLLASTLIFWVAARIYVIPRLHEAQPQSVLLPILLLHSFRHLGLMFLAAGATNIGMPDGFAYPAALGDLLAAVLAMASIPLVSGRSPAARPLVWLFNVVGSADLIAAIGLAMAFGADRSMGAAYWIPAFWVPSLLVTHYVAFMVLKRPWPAAARG